LPKKRCGLIVFEELNRCSREMRNSCLQLLTARRLNDYRLPDGWLPAACINPPDNDYDVQDMDPALLSRFVRFEVTPNRKMWLAWARAQGLHEDVLNYVDSDPEVFLGGDWRSTPRSWKYVSDHLLAWQRTGGSAAALEFSIAGEVGGAYAARFRDFREGQGERLPAGEDLLTDYGRHQKRVQGWRDAGRLDPLRTLTNEVHLLLQGDLEYAKNGERYGNLVKFLADLPPDLTTGLRTWLEGYEYDIPAVTPARTATPPRKRKQP
jgi:hypothetical protein